MAAAALDEAAIDGRGTAELDEVPDTLVEAEGTLRVTNVLLQDGDGVAGVPVAATDVLRDDDGVAGSLAETAAAPLGAVVADAGELIP